MAKFRKKLRRVGRRVARGARSLGSGIKSTGIEGVAGVVAAYGDTALRKVEAIGKRDWAPGALIVVAGHLMKRSRRLGAAPSAVVGAGGLLLGQALQRSRAAKAAAAPAAPAAPASGGTSGFDTGMVYRFPSPAADTGFVTRSGARKLAV